MGQCEVFQWLKNQRLAGHNDYFTTAQVARALREQGIDISNEAVRGNLMRLTLDGHLSTQYARHLRDWPGGFRVKKSHIAVDDGKVLTLKIKSEVIITADCEKGVRLP